MTNYSVRQAIPADVGSFSALARAQGWRADALATSIVLRHGIGMVVDDPDAGVIAAGALVQWGKHGSIGKMVVHPDHQRKGLGTTVLQQLLSAPNAPEAYFLSATTEGVPLYRNVGFVSVGVERVMMGHWDAAAAQATMADAAGELVCRDVTDADRDQLIDFDAAAMGATREFLWDSIFEHAERIIVAEDAAGELVAVAARWFNEKDDAIGPVVATSVAAAQCVTHTLAAGVADLPASDDIPRTGRMRVDIFVSDTGDVGCANPDDPQEFEAWLAGCGLRNVEELIRMRRGVAPRVPERTAVFAGFSHATG